MPFTVIQSPPSLSPVRSPVRLVLKDLEYLAQSGSAATWTLTFTAVSVDGDQIRIVYGQQDVTLLCTSGPLLSTGTSFLEGATNSASALAFSNGAKLNYFLSRDFTITVLSNAVTFTAKQVGAAYNPALVQATGSVAISSAITLGGSDRVFRTDHHVGLAIWVEEVNGSGIYTRLPDQAGHPTDDQIVSFDLSTWLRPYVDADAAPYSMAAAAKAVDSVKRYYVQYWSRYPSTDGSAPERAVYTSGTFKAWLAGNERAELARFNGWMAGVTASPFRFLTWRGRSAPREVTKAERHFLNWYDNYTEPFESEDRRFILEVKVFFPGTDSGWFETIDVDIAALAVSAGSIIIWPMGWDALGLTAILTDMSLDPLAATGYSVRIKYAVDNPIVSETFRFTLVEPDYQEVFIQFLNSLGAWESVRFTGAWQRLRDDTYQEFRRTVPYTDDANTEHGALGSEALGGQRRLVANSSLNALAEHRAILDLLGSPAIRSVDTANSRYLPLRISEAADIPVEGLGIEEEHQHQLQVTFLADDAGSTTTVIP